MFLYRVFSLLPFTVCIVWAVILGLDNREKWIRRDRKPLFAFALVCTVLYLGHAWHFNEDGTGFNLIDCLYIASNLAVYPLYYLYIRSLTLPEGIRPKDNAVLLPAALMLTGGIICLVRGLEPDTLIRFGRIVFPFTVLFTCFFGLKLLLRYNKAIHNIYSDTEHKTLNAFIWLIILFVATSFISIFASLLGRDSFQGSVLIFIPSLLFSSLLFALFYLGSRLEFSVEDALREVPLPDEQERALPEPTGGEEALMREVDALMGEKELFRSPGLKITDVAEVIGTNRTYLSNAVNRLKRQSFSDYINSLRVEAAKTALRTHAHEKTLSAIAEESGFSSEATFYRQFRHFTGCTPGSWLKKNRG